MNYKETIIKSRLKYYRVQASLTQHQLAKMVGCSDYMIQLIEYDKITPNIKLAYTLSMVLSDKLGETVTITMLFINYSNYYY